MVKDGADPPMNGGQDDDDMDHVHHLKARVDRGEYQIDPCLVAEALLRRVVGQPTACSWPASPATGVPPASSSRSSGEPAVTRPITVAPATSVPGATQASSS